MSITKVSQSLTAVLGIVAIAISAASARATLLITEINSNGTGGDFFELYNSGTTSIDMTGWRWSDYDVRNWGTASSFDTATLSPGEVAVVGAGSNVAVPTPLNGSASANANFRTSWGLAAGVKMLTWTGNGAGLGSGDGVILFNASGNVATSLIYRIAPLVSATNQDLSTVALSTFTKSFEPQPTANGHAGVMGGVGATPAGTSTESLVWDPNSPIGSPTFRNAVVGQFAAFANPNSATTIGSPGIVPEPSTIAMAALGGALAVAHAARRRFGRRDAGKHTAGA